MQLVSDIGSLLGTAPQPVAAYRRALLSVLKTATAHADPQETPPTQRVLTLTSSQEAVLKTFIDLDADYVYVSQLAARLEWKLLTTQAIVDQLGELELLSAIVGDGSAMYGLSADGRSLALKLELLG